MVKIENYEKGYLIGDVVVIGTTAPDKVTLATEKGPSMNYGEHNVKVVNFPGEYDINGVAIECMEADNVLSYLVKIDDKQIAILQNSAALEVGNFDGIQERVCTDSSIKDEIENLDLEGEIIVLGEGSDTSERKDSGEKKKK